VSVPREIWVHALGAKVGGGLTYLRSVLPELVRRLEGSGTRLVLLLPAPLAAADPAALPDPLPPWIEVRPLPRFAASPASRVLFDQLVLPLWLLGRRFGGLFGGLFGQRRRAALFCSGSFAPLLPPVRTVALLRNAIYFDDEFLARELPGPRRSLRLQGRLIAAGARRAHEVHFPSASFRRQVEQHHPRLAGQARVNGYGVHPLFSHAGAPAAVAGNGHRPRWTFLYVMTYTLQKNLGFLLQALAQAKAEGLPVTVQVTSRLDDGPRASAAADRALIEEHQLVASGYLEPIGPCFGADLLAAYEAADACLFPSLCESFGHPLVEAMALGKPLIAADRPYARELCGPHALYVDPGRPEELVALWRRWPEPARGLPALPREELLQRFSWSDHVDRLLAGLGWRAA
jgi:glycosyltransferase involved in cell wall biosynthesis